MAPLNDPETAACVRAERAFSRALGGSCQVPLGGYAVIEEGRLWLRGFVATPDGREMVAGEIRGEVGKEADDDERLGRELADRLRAQGAGDILDKLAQAK
ncbi:MAG TPA: hydroxymethylbilane synthase, partial [Rhodocyclaceae bacterium]|nr:hydroxymethylbilane synthase [Rhodocyclaceae bacterium]